MGVDVNDTELKKAYRKAAMKVCVSLFIVQLNAHYQVSITQTKTPRLTQRKSSRILGAAYLGHPASPLDTDIASGNTVRRIKFSLILYVCNQYGPWTCTNYCFTKNMRTVYDKHGKSMGGDGPGDINMEDAAGFFANVFGGNAFGDYVRYREPLPEMKWI